MRKYTSQSVAVLMLFPSRCGFREEPLKVEDRKPFEFPAAVSYPLLEGTEETPFRSNNSRLQQAKRAFPPCSHPGRRLHGAMLPAAGMLWGQV